MNSYEWREKLEVLAKSIETTAKQPRIGCELKKCGVGGKVLPIPVEKR